MSMSVYVCVCVCLFPHLKNHMCELHRILCTCYLCPVAVTQSSSMFIFSSVHDVTHTQLFYGPLGFCLGLPGWAGTWKVKPGRWNQSGFTGARDSEWHWHQLGHMQIYTWSRLITTPASHHSVFTGLMPFLPPNQQCQSTEGICLWCHFSHNGTFCGCGYEIL